MVRTNRYGYTLIEMMVVTMLLALFSGIMFPQFVNMRDSQVRRSFFTKVVDLAGTARELAISSKATMYLQADSTAHRIMIKREVNDSTYAPADNSSMGGASKNGSGNSQANIGTSINDRSNDTTDATLDMPSAVQFGNYQLAGQTSDESSWKVRFFPDGTCDGGAVELDDKGKVKTLVVNKHGGASLSDGNLPDASQDRWQAGNYVQRQQ